MSETSPTKVRTMDIPVLDKMSSIESSWVLDSSNRTFAEFVVVGKFENGQFRQSDYQQRAETPMLDR